MAFITAETRSSIVELAMGMLNQAPSTALLNTLIAKSVEGASIQDLADYIATTDAFTAEYPATQTAREFATEMFGKLITGGTLDADINTAVIDLLEGLLIAGTTKAQGFVAVIEFLANPANVSHPDLGDISQSFQNRADAAEYFSITKELGGSTDAELAAAIASVTSDADTLTAANEAADATADAEEVVAGQTFTLTTGVEEVEGTNADETFTAPALSATTGADITTLNNGDVIDGGAGTDTLNITATADDNNSLTGVTIKNMEIVNITGADNIDASKTADATAVNGAKQAIAINVSNPAPVAEVHSIDFGDLTVATAGSITIGTSSSSDFKAAFGVTTGIEVALAAGDTAEEIATKVAAKLKASEGTTGLVADVKADGAKVLVTYDIDNGLAGTTATLYDPSNSTLSLLDAAAGTTATFATAGKLLTAATGASVAVEEAASATVQVTVSINGVEYDAGDVTVDVASAGGSTTDANYFSATTALADEAKAAAAAGARDLAKNLINKVLGGTVTAADGNEAAELLVSAKAVGSALPSIGISSQEVSIAAVDSKDSQAVTNEARTSLTTAIAQQQTISVSKVGVGDTFELFIDGASYGTITAGTNSEATQAKAIADAINVVLGDGTALAVGDTVTVTAPEAGTVLPAITIDAQAAISAIPTTAVGATLATYLVDKGIDASADATTAYGTGNAAKLASVLAIDEAVEAISRENVAIAKATVSATDGSIDASDFGGAEQIWLKGDSNSTNVSNVTSQTIGLSGISSMDNEIAYKSTATSGSIAVNGAKGDLKITGAKLATLNISGTGSTNLDITDASDAIETVAIDVSGALVLDITAADAVTTLTSSGKGGVTLTSDGLEVITTGAGADSVTAKLTTVKDNANTAADETKSSVVSTGDGADTVVIATGGTGVTTVETGAGDDTIKLTSMGSGDNLVEAGVGNDYVWLTDGLAEVSATNVVDAGDGIDTLNITAKNAYTAGDYARFKVGALNFEKIVFSDAAGTTSAGATNTPVDASKFAGISTFEFHTGSANVIKEVAGSVILGSQIPSADAYTGARANTKATGVTVSALGYELDSDLVTSGNQTVYGGDLYVQAGGLGLGNSVTVNANGANATIVAASVAGITGVAADSAPVVDLNGDLQTASVVLSSSRNKGTELMAGVNVTLDPSGASNQTLIALETLKVSGAGAVTINTVSAGETITETLVNIDLSGMTAFANLDADGDNEGGSNGYDNKSTSTLTLNNAYSETVTLGGAKDTVVLDSTVAKMDTIIGFQLAATADTTDADDTVDTDVSDVINVTGSTVEVLKAKDTEYSSLDEALLALSADASTDPDVVFHADGNTYIFLNTTDGLDDSDVLIELVGTYDLDLLVNVVS